MARRVIYGVDFATRRIAISGPGDCLAALLLSDPRPGTHLAVTPREVELLGGFVAAVVPPGAVLWLERPFVGRPVGTGGMNIKSAIRLGMSAGAIFARHAGVAHIVDQSVWKAAVIGSGNATKDDVASWLATEDPARAEACAGDQDLIDACAIRRYGELVTAGGVAPPSELRRRPRRGHVRTA